MFAGYHIAQLEWLAQLVIGFVRLIVQDDMNVVAFAGGRILVRHIALEIAAKVQLHRYRGTVDDGIFRRRHDFQNWLCLVLLAALLHQIQYALRPGYDG